MKVILYNHTHWDREWYQTFQEFRLRFAEVIGLILRELENNNIQSFYLDGQTVILEDYFSLYPENKEKIVDFIKQKRIFTGPWYVLADEFLTSGESLMRNLLFGINRSKEFGCKNFTGYLPDSFGHNSEIPRILNAFNIKNSILWRGAGNRKDNFLWESPGGSQVKVTYLTEGYFQDILHRKISIEEKSKLFNEIILKIKEKSLTGTILIPVGADHLGPVIGLKDLITGLNSNIKDFFIKEGTITEYLEETRNIAGLETVKGELRNNSANPILPGTYSTRLYLKKYNAVSTWKLSKIAEPLQSFLEFYGLEKSRKNEINSAWKLLLQNHPHDSICGCSIDSVHRENVSRFEQADQISGGIINRCMNNLSLKTEKGKIFVVNLSDYDYSGVIRLKTSQEPDIPKQLINKSFEFPKHILLDPNEVPFSEYMEGFREYLINVENIPPHSVILLGQKDFSEPENPVKINDLNIENSLIKLSVNPDGSIKLEDFTNNKTFDNLHIISDRADVGDTYNFAPPEQDKPLKAEFINTEIVEQGTLRSILRINYKIDIPEKFIEAENKRSRNKFETAIETDIILTANSRRAEFITRWENKSCDHTLKIKFKTPQKVDGTISENTFGLIERNFDPGYKLENLVPAKKGEELNTNTAPMQRFVIANGLGIITEGLSEYGVKEDEIFITILRSVGKLSKLSLNTRNFPAGPPLDTPEAQCTGLNEVRYALYLPEKPEELFRQADEFMGSVLTDIGISEITTEFEPKQFLNINNKNIYTYSVKTPENKDLKGFIARLMNLSSEEQVMSPGKFSKIQEIKGFEEPVSEVLTGKIIFKPFELKSLLIN